MNVQISLAQYPILFHKSMQSWILTLENWFQNAKKTKSQLLVFPEYASLELMSLLKKDSTLKEQLKELQTLHDFFLENFILLSRKYNVYTLAPSFPIQVDQFYFNRAYFISPSGNYDFQDKLHMTRFEEDWGISPSQTELKIFETNIGNFGVQICFDVEFPWATSLLASKGAKVILSPSCTEGIAGLNRVHIGGRARALENQIYVAISQTVGEARWSSAVDINNGIAAIYAPSDSLFPENGIIATGSINDELWISCNLDLTKIEKIREEGEVHNFKNTIKYPWEKFEKKNLKFKLINL